LPASKRFAAIDLNTDDLAPREIDRGARQQGKPGDEKRFCATSHHEILVDDITIGSPKGCGYSVG